MTEIALYKKVIALNGAKKQINMVIEECAELIVVICHANRDRATVIDIAQEVADVEIMCSQLREIIGNEIVTQCKKEKLLRLKQRIDAKERKIQFKMTENSIQNDGKC